MYEIRIPKCARQEPGTTQSRACKDARLQFQTWHRITAVHWRDATCTAAVEVVILRPVFLTVIWRSSSYFFADKQDRESNILTVSKLRCSLVEYV